jgi:hypothetical protein
MATDGNIKRWDENMLSADEKIMTTLGWENIVTYDENF